MEDSIDNNEPAEEGDGGNQPSQNEYAEEVNVNNAEVTEHGSLGSLLYSIFGRWQGGHGGVPSSSRPHPFMDAAISSPPSAESEGHEMELQGSWTTDVQTTMTTPLLDSGGGGASLSQGIRGGSTGILPTLSLDRDF